MREDEKMQCRRIRVGQIGDNQTIRFAVTELVSYLKKMDTELMVDVLKTNSRETAFHNTIWVGLDSALLSEVEGIQDEKQDDAIIVKVQDNAGYISGSIERSVLFAVYRFLKAMGCNWIRPGKEGERIPKRAFEDVDVNICEVASYRQRGVCIEGANSYENLWETIDYLPKLGLNTYLIQHMEKLPCGFLTRWYQHENNETLSSEPTSEEECLAMIAQLEQEIALRGLFYQKAGHGWTSVPLGLGGSAYDEESLSNIPEDTKALLAMRNGQRTLWKKHPMKTNLCYSNPIARRVMVDAMVAYCKENPSMDVLQVWLADDNNNQCECEECTKKRPADWYVILLNELDQKLTEENIDIKIVFGVYQDLLWAPMEEKIHNKERFTLMFCPYDRELGEHFNNNMEYEEELPTYVRNELVMPLSVAETLEHLRRWKKNYDGKGFVFDYYLMWAHLNDLGYEKCARQIHADVKALQMLDMDGMMSCQVQRAFFPTALPFYMMAATLWNRECDYETVAKEYYEAAFGEDGNLVGQFMQKISDLFVLYDGPFWVDASRIYGPFCKDYEEAKRIMDEFTMIVKRNLDKEKTTKKEWALLKLHGEYLAYIVRSMELLEKHKDVEAKENLEQFLKFMKQNEIEMQRVFDVHNAVGHWDRSLNSYYFK